MKADTTLHIGRPLNRHPSVHGEIHAITTNIAGKVTVASDKPHKHLTQTMPTNKDGKLVGDQDR
jgi:hypothetical protein